MSSSASEALVRDDKSGSDAGANREEKSIISETICCQGNKFIEKREEDVEAKEKNCTFEDGAGKIYRDLVKNEKKKNVSETEWQENEVKLAECITSNLCFTTPQGQEVSSVGRVESEIRQLTVWNESGFKQNRTINKQETSKLGDIHCNLFSLGGVAGLVSDKCQPPDEWGGSVAAPIPRPSASAAPECQESPKIESPVTDSSKCPTDIFKPDQKACYHTATTTGFHHREFVARNRFSAPSILGTSQTLLRRLVR